MALQVQEGFFQVERAQMIGLKPRGDLLAAYLKEMMEKDNWTPTRWNSFSVDKAHPTLPEGISPELPTLIVDDVLNTGFTLGKICALLIQNGWKRIEALVLVDRGHYAFPLRATYTGLQLATTFHDYVELRIHPPDIQVYLK